MRSGDLIDEHHLIVPQHREVYRLADGLRQPLQVRMRNGHDIGPMVECERLDLRPDADRARTAASQQQLAGLEQIAQAIRSINEASSQATTGTRQVERQVQHLQRLALELKGLTGSAAES